MSRQLIKQQSMCRPQPNSQSYSHSRQGESVSTSTISLENEDTIGELEMSPKTEGSEVIPKD